jgi:peptidoglycan hydrolase-like protein with peptidoglycan-binding domain
VTKGSLHRLVETELAKVDYVESGGATGHDGNITFVWADLDPGLQGQPWCAGFQRWSFVHAGVGDCYPKAANPYYCPSLWQYAKDHRLADTSGHYSRGDLIIYNFALNGVADHVELCLDDDGHELLVVGGNTSPGDSGDQRNGGGVYRKHRPHGPEVLGAIKTSRLLPHRTLRHPIHAVHTAAPAAHRHNNPWPAPHRVLRLAHAGRHLLNGRDVRWVQWAAGATVDGQYGTQTDYAVRHFQHYHHLAVDGVVGPKTRRALAAVTH